MIHCLCFAIICYNNILSEVFFLIQFEADRRAFIITINSFGTELSKEDRAKLFPHCGKLYPEGLAQLARADDYEQVKAVADYYPVSSLRPHGADVGSFN